MESEYALKAVQRIEPKVHPSALDQLEHYEHRWKADYNFPGRTLQQTLLTVDTAPMPDRKNDNFARLVIHAVNDSVVSDANAPFFEVPRTPHLFRATGPWIFCKLVYRFSDAPVNVFGEPALRLTTTS